MEQILNRIERRLKANHYVEAEDIRSLVEHTKAQDRIIEMFIKQIHNLEKKVWVKVVEAYTRSPNSTNKEGAVSWANYISDEYKKRFPTQN